MEIFKKQFDLSNKVVIVTGAGRGNGLQIAKDFHKMGSIVYRIDKKIVNLKKKKLIDINLDLSNLSKIKSTILSIYKKHKRIDVLVNNVGVSISSKMPYEIKVVKKTLDINLLSIIEISYCVAEIMKKKKNGSIINITSLGAHQGFESNPSYQVSKSGLSQLTRAMAKDYGNFGIRVNSICPGYIKTNMTIKSYLDIKRNKMYKNRTMLKRWGKSEDLSGPCLFLASKLSSYITASEILVDGGWLKNSY